MKALLIVDMQNDFMPLGALGVKGGNEIIQIINHLIPHFSLIVASKDWHPADHVSFAKTHQKKEGEVIEVKGRRQVLWPLHCLQHSHGAEIVQGLNQEMILRFFHKGENKEIDSYSAFFDNQREKSTGLDEFLKSKGVNQIYLAGLTTDYCVKYTALDGCELGYEVFVILDACRPINLSPDDEKNAIDAMKGAGAHVIDSSAVLNFFLKTI